MKPEAMLKELEDAADKLAVKVSYESLAASVRLGGLCRVKGQYRVIIDKRATPEERATTLAEALSRLDTGTLEMSSPVRQLLDYYAVRRAS